MSIPRDWFCDGIADNGIDLANTISGAAKDAEKEIEKK